MSLWAPLVHNFDHLTSLLWNMGFAASVSWIVYRIYQIYRIPVSELVEILGFDIPPVPDVALSTITSDSVLLYIKAPENYHTPLKVFVQVNLISVGDVNPKEASFQITGLISGYYYSIRVVAISASNFSSFSRSIQIQTVSSSGYEGSKTLAAAYGNCQVQVKRRISGQKVSSVTGVGEVGSGHSSYNGDGSEDGSEETLAQLTKRLDSLRRQKEEIDRQIFEDAAEAERLKAIVIGERDDLRQKVEEKEKAHLEFRKQVNESEKQSKAAQRRKSAKERLLQQKKAERQKLKDDIVRWATEAEEAQKDVECMKIEKEKLQREHVTRMSAARKLIDEAQVDNRALEEEIRVWGVKIKDLEEERKRSDQEQNQEEQEAEQCEKEEEQGHERRILEYQADYTRLWKVNQQTETEERQAQDRLNYLLAQRAQHPHMFAPILGLDTPTSIASNPHRRFRQGASRGSTISHSSTGYPTNSSLLNNISCPTTNFSSHSSFFNSSNGMTISGNFEHGNLSQRDIENLSGGGPMSPTADTLLPSNLLRDDDASGNQFFSIDEQHVEDSATSYDFPPYRPLSTQSNNQDPHSPTSENSRSPSLLSSPHESIHNQQIYHMGRKQLIEGDHQSVASTGSPYSSTIAAQTNNMARRGISDLFTFNRQRGKSSLNDPPLLGTLKQGQSQSFPRNFSQGPLDPLGTRRRLSSSAWTNPMSSFLARNTAAEGETNTVPHVGLSRRSRLHMFGSKLEPLNPLLPLGRSSTRPSSTYSFENTLPRPSTDSQPFGWASGDAKLRSRADWASLGGPWSRSQSRRPSVQHGSSTDLSVGTTPLEPDEFSLYGNRISPPAPIGTERFQLSQRSSTPKLNPAAPSFTTRLFSRSDTKKSAKGEKPGERGAEKSRAKDIEKPKEIDSDHTPEDCSPSNSRRSRDARSIVTATSVADSHDSLEQSVSGTPSDTANTAHSKGSLIQRITRKSSSSKFNAPWSKDRSNIFSKKSGEPLTPSEVNENPSNGYSGGKSTESISNTAHQDKGSRGNLSWSRVMRKSKKGEKPASETSEKASEMETGDDDEI